jgi:hypothetical protein
MVSPWASMKALMSAAAAGHPGGRGELGELGDGELLGMVADRARVVEDPRRRPGARSSSQVAVTYSKSKGGSWRISTASKAVSGRAASPPGSYQARSSSVHREGQGRGPTPRRHPQASASRWMAKTWWPRRAAARIIAMLESL